MKLTSMKLKTAFFSAVVAATCALIGSASASTLYVQTTPAGAAALFPGQPVITFDSAAPGTYSSYTSDGVTFTSDSGAMHIDNAYIGVYNTFGVNSLHNCYCSDSFGTLNMAFSSPVSGVGFFWGASDNQWTLSVYNSSDTLIESFLLPITHASNAGDFVGIKDPGIAFAVLSGPSSDYIFVDNVTGVSTIPEASTWAMLMLGFAALGFAGYRRAKTAPTVLTVA
jgi:hypothetical protein